MDSVYSKLREQLDKYSLGFPSTESGVEIKLLKKLFSEKHAEFHTKLSQKLETVEEVAARLNMPLDEAREILEEMTAKGLIFSQKSKGNRKYGTIAFMHGILEFQIKTVDKELAELLEQYGDEGFDKNVAFSTDNFLRVIPVEKYVDIEHHIAAYEDVKAILDKVDTIVVTECFCRKREKILDKGCSRPVEACFMFGSMGQYYLDKNMGRQVSKDEALKIVAECQKSGLVTQPGTSQNPAGMCNCCGDCCGVLGAIKRYPKPAELVFSNYYSSITAENCTGCGSCVDICQMEAIQINSSGTAEVNLDRCIGCGLCLVACNFDAVKLNLKSGGKRSLSQNTSEQFAKMAQKRGLI